MSETTLPQEANHPEAPSQTIWQRVADFIVKAEFSREKPIENTNLQSLQINTSKRIDENIYQIRSEINHFKDIMTRSGALKWRSETERLIHEGQREVQDVTNAYRELKSTIVEQCDNLNRASMNTVKNVAQLVSSVKHANIRKLNDEKTEDLEYACESNLQKVDHIVHTFHWKNLLLVILISALVSTIVSLYVDDGWPWQIHAQVAKERQAGKVLMNSWSQLTQSDQLAIENV